MREKEMEKHIQEYFFEWVNGRCRTKEREKYESKDRYYE